MIHARSTCEVGKWFRIRIENTAARRVDPRLNYGFQNVFCACMRSILILILKPTVKCFVDITGASIHQMLKKEENDVREL